MVKSVFYIILFLTWATTQPAMVWSQAQGRPAQVSLGQLPRVYGLSVASSEGMILHLATPMGLYLSYPQGNVNRVPGLRGHLMAFAVHPRNPQHMLAGGHVGRSGSMGVMLSTNGGKSWKQLSETAAGHVGFHILEISRADPNTIYGVTNGLRVSNDGGRTWREAGKLPANLIHFAASSKQVKTLYAATRQGLLISHDQGAKWKPVNLPGGITSMVHVTPTGKVYVFVIGVGLLAAQEPKLDWKKVSARFDDQILFRMAVDPASPNRLYASTVTGAVVASRDGGRNWLAYEGLHNAKPKFIAKGKKLFNTYCQPCHGTEGRGQHTTAGFDPKNPPRISAPALNDTAHAWHHSDEGLTNTILNGSPREGSPMIAWKAQFGRADAESLVAYIKSLWSFRSIACQGARHMACMRQR